MMIRNFKTEVLDDRGISETDQEQEKIKEMVTEEALICPNCNTPKELGSLSFKYEVLQQKI